MTQPDPFEPGTHVFSGVVRAWTERAGELVTDSGLLITFSTQNHPAAVVGSRITVTMRKFRPHYALVSVAT
jgi:hypothetical protein